MAKTQFLTFYICQRDPDQVAANQAIQWVPAVNLPNNGGIITNPLPAGLVNRAITGAEDEFSAPFRGYTQPVGVTGDFIWTPWSGAGEEDGPFPLNVATFTRKTGGFFGIGGTTTKYYWLGQFVYVPPDTPVNPNTGAVVAAPSNLAEVIWADGFELAESGATGEGGVSGAANSNVMADASRHVGGYGWAQRHTTANIQKEHRFNEYGGSNPSEAWSRIYIRVRRLPDGQGAFWRCHTSTAAGAAIELKFTSAGTMALFAPVSTVLTLNTTSTFVFETNRWYRLDMLMRCGQNPPNDGRFRLFVDGDQENPIFDVNFTTNEGLGGGGASPRLQDVAIGSAENINGLEVDFDDWTAHTFPTGPDGGWTGRDWLNGSRVIAVRPTSLQSATDWTGDVRSLWQTAYGAASGIGLVSTTSGATLAVETDLETEARAVPGSLGILAFNVAVKHVRASGTANSQLGYALDGATWVDANKSVSTTEIYSNVMVSLHAGGATPTAVPGPLRFRYIKSADATQLTVRNLSGAMLLYGAFGPEDVPPYSDLDADDDEEGAETPAVPVGVGIHNHPYPHSPWAMSASSPPLSPVWFKTGSYTGNATVQDLTFPVPINFLWVRPVSGATGAGLTWWSSAVGGHISGQLAMRPDGLVRAYQNTAFDGVDAEEGQQESYVLSIIGTDTQFNANGVTYQYIAISDPGQRLMMNGAFRHGTVPTTATNPLVDADFTPLWGFFQNEDFGNATTQSIYLKGPGNAAGSWQQLSAGEVANGITFGAGSFTSGSSPAGLDAGNGFAFSLFRQNDGIVDANGASQEGKCWQMWSYVGDGAASRTMSFPLPTGVRPLVAFVNPINAGTPFYRDPAHTTNTSSNLSSGSLATTTAITGGGVNQITVGTTLNSNGVTYNVLVFMGSATAGNGGWSIDGTFTPVEADSPTGSQWPDTFPGDPTEAPEEEEDTADPNDPGALDTDIAANCVSASTRLCNVALSRLGITARLTSLADDDSVEADQLRLVYKNTLDACLRAFPWQFATAYADVVHQGGVDADDPVTGDWVHSYRQPADCVFVRRIVRPELRRTYDPDPPAFRTFADDDRQLIYANEPGEKLEIDDTWVDADGEQDPTQYTFEIEYTRRVDCPASRGDSIFRSCAAWLLASEVAVALGKDPKEQVRCFNMFVAALPKAEVVTAREQQHQDTGSGDPDWIRGR